MAIGNRSDPAVRTRAAPWELIRLPDRCERAVKVTGKVFLPGSTGITKFRTSIVPISPPGAVVLNNRIAAIAQGLTLGDGGSNASKSKNRGDFRVTIMVSRQSSPNMT